MNSVVYTNHPKTKLSYPKADKMQNYENGVNVVINPTRQGKGKKTRIKNKAI